jgi:penicillin-binding protein 1C
MNNQEKPDIANYNNYFAGAIFFFRKYKKTIIISLFLFLIFYLSLPAKLFPVSYSTVVLDENNQILRIFLNKDEQWYFPPDKNLAVPEKLKKAIIYYEDRYFYYHFGINPVALVKAFSENISRGKTVRGASTITMQVARLASPKKRTYLNKLREIIQALKIELWYGKNDILQMYVENAPYGGNIIGYQAASLKYYRKKPEQLTWGEAATLAVLPNAPGLISPVSKKSLLVYKRNQLLGTLYTENIIDPETYKLALREPVPGLISPPEINAPHLAQFLKTRMAGESNIIRTTINKEIQQNIEALVKNHIKYLNLKGIRNGAALVVETKTGKVRAYAGSQNFFDKENKGEVDGVIAPRSSGSILKPFLYALGMDEGILLSQTQLKDVPSFFGSFSPENADKKFNGIVTAREALVRSLNVPAVRLLQSYGVYDFYLFLKQAGLTTLFRDSDDYGLTLPIGGAETTLFDLAVLYRGLANYGNFTPNYFVPGINFFASPDQKPGKTLISPGASYLTLEILKELKRPDSEYYWQQYENQFKVAWKTGTSYGNRDAWAVGVNPQWTVAVWTGNFNGEGNPNLAGALSSGSLMFDIFNYLPKNQVNSWFTRPTEFLGKTEICQETGFRAGPSCPKKILVDSPAGMKPLPLCPYHHNIFVTRDESRQVCSLCWKQGDYKQISFLLYPPDVVQYLRERGRIISEVPPHKEDCPGSDNGLPLQIIYPEPGSKLWLPRDIDGKLQKLTIRLAHLRKTATIYWYLDDSYLGSTSKNHAKAIEIKKGWHSIEVVDDQGHRVKREFHIDEKT